MPYKDLEKKRINDRAKAQRYLRRKKIEKYGIEYADMDMKGRHGHQPRGPANGKWNGGVFHHSDGYIGRFRPGVARPWPPDLRVQETPEVMSHGPHE